MKIKLTIMALLLCGLSACQTVPAERKTNCACDWEEMKKPKTGDYA